MGTVVNFDHRFDYIDTEKGAVPALVVSVSNPRDNRRVIDVVAQLDTGAERTLFDGEIAASIGLDLFSGGRRTFSFTTGGSMRAYEHNVILSHPLLGPLPFNVCFSIDRVYRNLLGRDFFNQLQLGLRHRQQLFFITMQP